MLNKIRELYKKTVQRIKKFTSLSELMDFMLRRRTYYDDLIARAKSLSSVMTAVASDYEPRFKRPFMVAHCADVIDLTNGDTIQLDSDRGLKKNSTSLPTFNTKDGAKLRLESFKAPSRASLKSHTKLIDEMDMAIRELDAGLLVIRKHKGPNADRTRKQMLNYRNEMMSARNEADEVIGSIFEKHAPPMVDTLCDHILSAINNELKDIDYDYISEDVEITVEAHDKYDGGGAAIEFVSYITVVGLKDGDLDPQDVVFALTCLVREGRDYVRAVTTKSEQAALDRKDAQLTNKIKVPPRFLKALDAAEEALDRAIAKGLTDKTVNRLYANVEQVREEIKQYKARQKAKMQKVDIEAPATKAVKETKAGAGVYYASYHLNILPRVLRPGTFPLGDDISGGSIPDIRRKITRSIRSLASTVGIGSMLGRMDVKLSERELKASALKDVAGVSDIRLEGKNIILTLNTDKVTVVQSRIAPEVLLTLNTMFRVNRTTKFQTRFIPNGTTGPEIQAFLVKG